MAFRRFRICRIFFAVSPSQPSPEMVRILSRPSEAPGPRQPLARLYQHLREGPERGCGASDGRQQHRPGFRRSIISWCTSLPEHRGRSSRGWPAQIVALALAIERYGPIKARIQEPNRARGHYYRARIAPFPSSRDAVPRARTP
jgi:hypothetical protein